jgi:tetratricopeptide (TPR) repeat protein
MSDKQTDGEKAQIDIWRELVEAGTAAYIRRRLSEAEVKFLQAVDEAEKISPDGHEMAVSRNNLAALYHSQGKYAFAESHYEKALQINKKIYGEESLECARNIYNLAVTKSASQHFEEACELYKQSLSLKERLLGRDHADLKAHIAQYAENLRRLKRDQEADALMSKETKWQKLAVEN